MRPSWSFFRRWETLLLVVLIIIRQINPRYLAIFNDASGQLLLALCLLSIVVGYASMLWITRLPGERRILR